MNIARNLLAPLVVLVWLVPSSVVHAQAYCALRDPVASVFELFPEAENFRSIVKVVGNGARDAIGTRLPLDLHFNELGKHTVYAAMKGQRPIGLVHARSESDRWGLTEIVWALDLDLKVVDFRFQRCRNTARRPLEESTFRAQLQGKSYAEIRKLLSDDAKSFVTDTPVLPDDVRNLALIVTHSALKTILVTQTVWETELHSLRTQRMLAQHFGDAFELDPIAVPYTPAIVDQLNQMLMGERTGIDRDAVALYRISTADGAMSGYLIGSPWRSGSTNLDLHWVMNDRGRILDALASGVEARPEIQASLASLRGFEAASTAQCANALELSAFELGVLIRGHTGD